jgi:hypothetical protein
MSYLIGKWNSFEQEILQVGSLSGRFLYQVRFRLCALTVRLPS